MNSALHVSSSNKGLGCFPFELKNWGEFHIKMNGTNGTRPEVFLFLRRDWVLTIYTNKQLKPCLIHRSAWHYRDAEEVTCTGGRIFFVWKNREEFLLKRTEQISSMKMEQDEGVPFTLLKASFFSFSPRDLELIVLIIYNNKHGCEIFYVG